MAKSHRFKDSIRLFCFVSLIMGWTPLLAIEAVLNPTTLGIDHKKKIILSNQLPIDLQLPSLYTALRATNLTFSLTNPTNQFVIGRGYPLISENEEEYILYFTPFPIITIITPNTINIDNAVSAKFWITEQDGKSTESDISIKIRGNYTASLNKKSFKVKFYDDPKYTTDKDVSVLGLRLDNEINLQALYNEPLRITSKTSFELWKEIHTLYYAEKEPLAQSGCGFAYTEMFLNNEYRGIYGIMEPMDRKQLKLQKMNGDEIRGEMYKGISWGNAEFNQCLPFDNSKTIWDGLELEYPKNKIDWQSIYNFVYFSAYSIDEWFYANYPTKLIVDNVIDYFIFLNLSYATDNAGKNVFIAKYDKGEPYFFAPWDLDGTWGWDWKGDRVTSQIVLKNKLHKRLLKNFANNTFPLKLNARWAALRKNILRNDKILSLLKRNQELLSSSGAYERENIAWNDYLYKDDDFEYTKDWLVKRIAFLDKQFEYTEDLSAITEHTHTQEISCAWDERERTLLVRTGMPLTLRIYNSLGSLIQTLSTNTPPLERIDLSSYPSGLYIVHAKSMQSEVSYKILIKGGPEN